MEHKIEEMNYNQLEIALHNKEIERDELFDVWAVRNKEVNDLYQSARDAARAFYQARTEYFNARDSFKKSIARNREQVQNLWDNFNSFKESKNREIGSLKGAEKQHLKPMLIRQITERRKETEKKVEKYEIAKRCIESELNKLKGSFDAANKEHDEKKAAFEAGNKERKIMRDRYLEAKKECESLEKALKNYKNDSP